MRCCEANKNHTFIFQTLKINCIVMLFNILISLELNLSVQDLHGYLGQAC